MTYGPGGPRPDHRWPRLIGVTTPLLVAFLFWVLPVWAVAECAYTPGDRQVVRRAITGELSEATHWTTMVIGTVRAVGPTEPTGYRPATVSVEAILKGPAEPTVVIYYPAINDEDFGGAFLVPGGRYFIGAAFNRFAGGLATDECMGTARLGADEARALVALAPSASILVPAAFDSASGPPTDDVAVVALIFAAVLALVVIGARARPPASRKRG